MVRQRGLLLIMLAAGSACRNLDLPDPSRPGSVTGQVTFVSAGRDQPEPAIGARGHLLGTTLETVAEAPEGRFFLTGLTAPASVLQFGFDVDGDGAPDLQRFVDLKVVHAGPGREVSLGEVLLGRNGVLTGQVLRGDRRALPGGHGGIEVFIPETGFSTRTGDDGSFHLEALPPGPFVLAASATGYAPFSQSVELSAGQQLELAPIVLEPREGADAVGGLGGTVTLSTGGPAAQVRVVARSGTTQLEATTDALGAFLFGALPTGVWGLELSRLGLKPVSLPNLVVTASQVQQVVVVMSPDLPGTDGGGTGGGTGGSGGGTGGGSGGEVFDVHFSTEEDGGVSGVLEWWDGGAVCVGQRACVQTFPAQTVLRLHARPTHPWASVAGWSVRCEGAPRGACRVTVTHPMNVTVRFDRPNFIFATEEVRVPGDVALEGDPAEVLGRWCSSLAEDAGLPGRYVAWVGYARTDGGPWYEPLPALFGARGWVRPDGLPVFDQLDPGTALTPLYLPSLTQRGRLLPSEPEPSNGRFGVATGLSLTSPTQQGHCQGFSSRTATSLYRGNPRWGGIGWSQSSTNFLDDCGQPHRFYCLGVDRAVPVGPDRSLPTRQAFTSALPWRLDGGGLASADEHCQREATATGRDGGFLAFLPSNGTSALGRFDAAGPPWARDDGVIVATADDLALLVGRLQAPLENGDAIPTPLPPSSGGPPVAGLLGQHLVIIGLLPLQRPTSAAVRAPTQTGSGGC